MTCLSGVWLAAPILFPMGAGLALFRMREKAACRRWVTLLLAVELVLFAAVTRAVPGGGALLWMGEGMVLRLSSDGAGRLFGLVACVLWLAAAWYAFDYMDHEENRGRFFGFFVVSLGPILGVCLAGNLISLYLFYEMMTMLTVPLVIHNQEKRSIAAGIKYMGFSVFGAGLCLLSLYFLQDFWRDDRFLPGGILDPGLAAGHETMLLVLYLLLMVGFGAKAGMFPLFTWLPAAHPVAPAPASAVLSGVITKMGVIAILRVTWYVYGPERLAGTWAQDAVLALSLGTVFVGSMLAYQEKVLKRRLAYSTVSQVSYILFGIFLLNATALQGSLLQFVFHAESKNALFLGAGAMVLAAGNTRVERLGGVGALTPASLGGFALGALSLIGIPPFGGFLSKWYLLEGALEADAPGWGWAGLAVLLVSALLTAGYLLPVVRAGFFPPRGIAPPEPACRVTASMGGVVLVLGGLTLLLGLFPGVLEPWIAPVVASLTGG